MNRSLFYRTGRLLFALCLALPFVAAAQEQQKAEKITYMRPSYWRPYDKSGINVFETPKTPDIAPFEGLRVRFGAGFTQQFQNLSDKNPDAANNQAANKLYPISPGFMTAQADLFFDVQLADGIRLNVTSYLSSRHHNETWVKGGFLQFDKLPFKGKLFEDIMKVTTIKVGHMEINYGDAHFRRSDGGQTIYNPFMESYIMDGYTTEIGGEIYVQKNGLLAMGAISSGMLKGNIDSLFKTDQDDNIHKSPALYFKAGFDKKLADNLRVRLTGSFYYNGSSGGNTLYGGDRTGSNYQDVMEKWKDATGAVQASTAIPFSGRFNPGFTKKIQAYMINGFVKAGGFEFFGTYENSQGRTKTETAERQAQQYGVDGVYRFGKAENLFIGLRYNAVTARLAGFTSDVTVNRVAAAAGWFLTSNILLKGEIVNQQYKDFPTTDYRAGGQFKGYVIEAVVGF